MSRKTTIKFNKNYRVRPLPEGLYPRFKKTETHVSVEMNDALKQWMVMTLFAEHLVHCGEFQEEVDALRNTLRLLMSAHNVDVCLLGNAAKFEKTLGEIFNTLKKSANLLL